MNTPARDVNLGRMKGRPVIDSNGDDIGTVEDVVLDPGTWRVSGFLVTLRREVAEALHIPRKGFLDNGPRIEITSDRVLTVGDNVLLNIDRGTIADALHADRPPMPGATLDERMPPTTTPYEGSAGYEPPRF
jgi:sporulation protein YlmC with PRC-barrel domain